MAAAPMWCSQALAVFARPGASRVTARSDHHHQQPLAVASQRSNHNGGGGLSALRQQLSPLALSPRSPLIMRAPLSGQPNATIYASRSRAVLGQHRASVRIRVCVDTSSSSSDFSDSSSSVFSDSSTTIVSTSSSSSSASSSSASSTFAAASHQLITFFRFAEVVDPAREVEEHKAFIAEHGLQVWGRIYINEQGINAQMSGKGTDGYRYARWVEARPHFKGMRISVYPSDKQGMHPKLSLRYKPQLVQLEGGTAHLPLTDPKRRAIPLDPQQWHERLGDVIAGASDAPVLLDVRNGYEWDVGHFLGAQRPVQESFRETVETNVQEGLGPLVGVDKARPIMMYCTGGIRCDVYSTVLKEQGYENVYTLEGGVQAYFDEFGKKEEQRWKNHLFVFDARLAMTTDGRPAADIGQAAATLTCHCCSQDRAPPPHRNCPNVDCNRLFLVCAGCAAKKGGFCCSACAKASHVRPPLLVPGRYAKYAHYTDGEELLRAERRGDGRKTRRRGL
mmetsp:Transcript_18729/g.46629  ORF Transcript_18729/g.46629 Transcript_18729/m.46629 type:complete len:506 (-) Transcript_18729:114-1631(-)